MSRSTTSFLAAAFLMSAALTMAQETAHAPDFTGDWRYDPARSDLPWAHGGPSGGRRGMGGPGGTGAPVGMRGRGGGGEGDQGWSGRYGAGREGGRSRGMRPRGAADADSSRRPARMPDVMHVTQTASLVSFEDSTGVVFEEVATAGAAADTFLRAPGALHVAGRWMEGRLIIDRPSQGKMAVSDTLSLEDAGRSLVVRTHVAGGDFAARDWKRVYRSAATP